MERKIGDTYKNKNGITLKVVAKSGCDGCFYACDRFKEEHGYCSGQCRKDKVSVIFVKI